MRTPIGSTAATGLAIAVIPRRAAKRSANTRWTRCCASPIKTRPDAGHARPLTNIALALARDQNFAKNIGRCVVMGGAPCCEGNVTPAAEYNIWVDPEAARQVFLSPLPVEMVGWHVSRGPRCSQTRKSPIFSRWGRPGRGSRSTATRARRKPISRRPASAAFRSPTHGDGGRA